MRKHETLSNSESRVVFFSLTFPYIAMNTKSIHANEGFNIPMVLGFPLSEANNNNINKDRSGFIKL